MAATSIEASGTHTRSVVNRLKHTWVIDKFSNFFIFENAESTDDDPAHPQHPKYPMCIFSKPFNCSQYPGIQFAIQLYPKGDSKESANYISLYLCVTFVTFTETAHFPVKYELSILNEHNTKLLSQDDTDVFSQSTTLGWDEFVERTTLFNPTYRFLANDQLTILCEIEVHSQSVAELAMDTCLDDLKSLSIAKNREMYGNLLESGDQSDVVLVLEDNEELKAHKNILSANSLVFKTMFECDMKEKKEGRVVIEDMTFDVARELLKFIYTGSVELLNCSAIELLSAADKYGLDLLKQICGQSLVGKVTTDSVASFLAFADAHSVDKLKRACMKYIRSHFAEVMLTENWPLVHKLVIEELRKEELPQEGQEEELLPKKKKVKQDNVEG